MRNLHEPGSSSSAQDSTTAGELSEASLISRVTTQPPAPGLEFQSLILSQVSDAVISISHTGLVTYLNPTAERQYATTAEQAILRTPGVPEPITARSREVIERQVAHMTRPSRRSSTCSRRRRTRRPRAVQASAAPGGAALFIAALTGWGQEEDPRRTQSAGFDAHLVKSVDPDGLLNVVEGARKT